MPSRESLALVALLCGIQAAAGAERIQPPPGAQRPSVRLQRILQDRGDGNVWGAVDSRRPLIGLRLSDPITDAARIARLKDAVDYVLIDPVPGIVTACEQAGLPWVGRITMGSSTDAGTARSAAVDTMESFADFPNLAGWYCPAESLATSQVELAKAADALHSTDPKRPLMVTFPPPESLPGTGLDAECYGAVKVAALDFRPVTAWKDRPHSPATDGLEIVRTGNALRQALPAAPAAVFAEWELSLPPDGVLRFGYAVPPGAAPGDGVDLLVKVQAELKPDIVWEGHAEAGATPQGVEVDVSAYGGRKVRLRFESAPGRARDTKGDVVDWIDPMLVAGGQQASLLESANWWQVRAGYRPILPDELARDVYTGMTGPRFDPAGCEANVGLADAVAALAGGRIALYSTHPTGADETATPQAFGSFWGRVLPFKPVAAVFRATSSTNALESELARWRALLQAVESGPGISRKRQITLVVPEGWAGFGSLSRALDGYGVQMTTIRHLGSVRSHPNVLLVLDGADGASRAIAAEFLSGARKRQKVLVFAPPASAAPGGESSRAAEDPLRQILPAYASGEGTRTVQVEALPGRAVSLELAHSVTFRALDGLEPVAGPEGQPAGAVGKDMLLLCGLPSADAKGLAELVRDWFGLESQAILDSGSVMVVRGEARADREGLYSIEEGGALSIADGLAAYDLCERRPLTGTIQRQALLLVFPRRGARLVDPGICYPTSIRQEQSDLVVSVDCPEALSDSVGGGPFRLVFWSAKAPIAGLGSPGGWAVTDMGDGYWQAVCDKPGSYTLRMAGARKPRGPAEWSPADH